MNIDSKEINKRYDEIKTNNLIDTEAYKKVIDKNEEDILIINNELENCINEIQKKLLKEQRDILSELNTRLYSNLELNIGCGVPEYDFNVDNKKINDLTAQLTEIQQLRGDDIN